MKKYKIGYTTGTFDMFHVGHLNLLEKAKQQCDYLIVGVNTDEWVYERKNKHPVICWEERAAIVESVKYVDKVISNGGLDKLAAWREHHFEVYFLGDDWQGKPSILKIEKELNSVGVQLEFIRYTDGISSTLIREKLLKSEG